MTKNYLYLSSLIAFLFLGACADETVSGFLPASEGWRLSEVNKESFNTPFAVRFPGRGNVQGTGICTSFTGAQRAPYPWFQLANVVVFDRPCQSGELSALEKQVIGLMQQTTQVEVSGGTLILTDGAELEIVLRQR